MMVLTVVVQPVYDGLEAVCLEDLTLDLGLGTHYQACCNYSQTFAAFFLFKNKTAKVIYVGNLAKAKQIFKLLKTF
jgi:hypothetical protein